MSECWGPGAYMRAGKFTLRLPYRPLTNIRNLPDNYSSSNSKLLVNDSLLFSVSLVSITSLVCQSDIFLN